MRKGRSEEEKEEIKKQENRLYWSLRSINVHLKAWGMEEMKAYERGRTEEWDYEKGHKEMEPQKQIRLMTESGKTLSGWMGLKEMYGYIRGVKDIIDMLMKGIKGAAMETINDDIADESKEYRYEYYHPEIEQEDAKA